jgi:hypothetical protein
VLRYHFQQIIRYTLLDSESWYADPMVVVDVIFLFLFFISQCNVNWGALRTSTTGYLYAERKREGVVRHVVN